MIVFYNYSHLKPEKAILSSKISLHSHSGELAYWPMLLPFSFQKRLPAELGRKKIRELMEKEKNL
jgi:hypothetical protein